MRGMIAKPTPRTIIDPHANFPRQLPQHQNDREQQWNPPPNACVNFNKLLRPFTPKCYMCMAKVYYTQAMVYVPFNNNLIQVQCEHRSPQVECQIEEFQDECLSIAQTLRALNDRG